MKRISILFTAVCLLAVSCGEKNGPAQNQGNGNSQDGGKETVETVMKTLWEDTSCKEVSIKRIKALDVMQGHGDLCENNVFKTYLASTDEMEYKRYEQGLGMLNFYNKAFERVVAEIQAEAVAEGSITVWQLYNMGYIVKTPDNILFGIDICHKRSSELVPLLDFALITHNHSDHYTESFVAGMNKAGKPLYSNYLTNDYKISGTQTVSPLKDSDIRFVTNIVDHGIANPANFVVTYEIDCGANSGNTVIFHIGDCGNCSQLSPTKAVDIFIPHVAVNLDMAQAVKTKVKPRMVLMSHVMQMEYPVKNSYRWPYSRGINECTKVDPNTEFAFMPVWGEKITYKRK